MRFEDELFADWRCFSDDELADWYHFTNEFANLAEFADWSTSSIHQVR